MPTSADVLSRSHRDGDRDVPQRQESLEEGDPCQRKRRHRPRGATPTPAQGVPALPRPENWPLLREALQAMGRADLIGNGKQHLVPRYQPAIAGDYQSARRKNSTAAGSHVSPVTRGRILTQHTGPPPRAG